MPRMLSSSVSFAVFLGSLEPRRRITPRGAGGGKPQASCYTATAFFLGLLRHQERMTAPNPVATATKVTENASMRRIAPTMGNQVKAAAMIQNGLKARMPVYRN